MPFLAPHIAGVVYLESDMDQAVSEAEGMVQRLLEEIEECHTQIKDLHWVASNNGVTTRLDCAKLIARLMQSQACAMMAVKHLRSDGTRHTCMVVHQGDTPTPKKTKTNAPQGAQ